ncbi:hypothetical protein ASE14_18980 [Agromyces sp. Root81]|uniref:hypothetical protein n=1 Tax=Agromyces sp. Root81 TaxID=1736601 RepID=UPI0006FA3A01|nr:hypothetical protein [Agromyces sp. Root81]KRC58633.1 hypothetical protein ASE14_18980 [Agromyces sp. Root81]
MRHSTIHRRAGAAAVIAAVTALLLSGCFANPGDLVNKGVEDAIEDATGGDVSLGGELPADFPESVALIDGDIAFAAGAGGSEGWIVMISSSAADPVGDAAAKLEAAGFTKDTTLSGDAASALVYSDSEYLVLLAGDGEAVSYTVTQQPK